MKGLCGCAANTTPLARISRPARKAALKRTSKGSPCGQKTRAWSWSDEALRTGAASETYRLIPKRWPAASSAVG